MSIRRTFGEKQGNGTIEDAFYGWEFDISEKAIRKLKAVEYQIKYPSVGRAENEIAIEIHCDAVGNTDQNGMHGANWYLWFFEKTNYGGGPKC